MQEVFMYTTLPATPILANLPWEERPAGGSDIVTWCNGYNGPTVGVGYTDDFQTFHQVENAFLLCNRNGVLFPRMINGKYAMLSHPSDNGHTPFGDIFYSESPDLTHWGCHRHRGGRERRLGLNQNRRRPDANRDRRRLAVDLPRRPDELQRLRLLLRRGPARPGRALARALPCRALPDVAPDDLCVRRRRAQRCLSLCCPGGRCNGPPGDLYMELPTPSSPWRSPGSTN
jgi:hypothetical protein